MKNMYSGICNLSKTPAKPTCNIKTKTNVEPKV